MGNKLQKVNCLTSKTNHLPYIKNKYVNLFKTTCNVIINKNKQLVVVHNNNKQKKKDQ